MTHPVSKVRGGGSEALRRAALGSTGPAGCGERRRAGYLPVMSILGRLMGTAQNASRGAARGGRVSGRPGRGMASPTGRGMRGGMGGGMGRGRGVPPAAGGIGSLVQGLLRRR